MNLFSLILATITLLIQEYADYDKEEDHNKTLLELKRDLNFPRIKSFDFIVVGGGTAGSLVAARLSEKFNVLLLESGGNPVPATESQFFSTAVQTDPTINNIFKSVPQFNFSQENGGIIETDTGKMLGGSGSHNDNVYNRGSPYDYDNFAKITGDNTWMYKNVLQHYKNFERLTGELIDETQRTEFYGTRGPVTVETKMSPIMPAWIQSARELGYGVHDPNGNQTEGFTPLVMSMINGKRVSAYSAFIKPIQNSRPTLTVLTYSEVEQVLINSDKRAYGVLYRRHGIIQVAHASKEVIVCAGTISSPLLLMRSGIGSKEVLEKAKIPVLSDLKGVGRNFQNHGSVVLHYKVNNPNKTLLLTVDENDMETEVMKYLDSKPSGILTKTNYAQAFIASSRAKSNGEGHWPDLQVGFGQQPAIVKGALQAISSNIKVGRMRSSGVVELNTTAYLNGFRDDLHLAMIDHRAFSDSSDVDVLIEGIQLSLKIMETTTPFRKMGVQLTDTSPQKCGSLVFRSRDYWKCYIQQRGQVVLHLTGTCSMGPKTDPMAVVDSKLRVYGIWRLRVVDGSIMPRTPNSNTNAPVMLVAEKASQDILATYASK